MTDTTHMTDAGGTDESRISEARARGVAKMNEVYGWDLPADVPGDFFAVTADPFLVFTSNVFAILGLRAMYFLLAAVASKFHLLNYGLAVILVFIGTKMVLIDVYKIPVGISLGVVVAILAVTMIVSARTAPHHESKRVGH